MVDKNLSMAYDSDGDYSLLHVLDKRQITPGTYATVTADCSVFEAESFSLYIMTSNQKPETDPETIVDLSEITDGTAVFSPGNRLKITVGQYITIFTNTQQSGMYFSVVDNNNNKLTREITDCSYTYNGQSEILAGYKVNIPGNFTIKYGNDNNSEKLLYLEIIEPEYM